MEGSESSSIWSSADKGSLSSYASGSPLHIIFSDYQNNHIYYFDPLNGNVVISAGVVILSLASSMFRMVRFRVVVFYAIVNSIVPSGP